MLPYILLSYAQSIDGQIATSTGDSQWISGDKSLRYTHELRNQYDAILVGSGTVERDDPQLTTRLPYKSRNPRRIILDRNLKLSSNQQVFLNTQSSPTTVFYSEKISNTPDKELINKHKQGVSLVPSPENDQGLDLLWITRYLSEMGIRSLFVEGGSKILTSFLRHGLFDRIIIFQGPILLGQGKPSIGDLNIKKLTDAIKPDSCRSYTLGKDLVWDLEFKHKNPKESEGNFEEKSAEKPSSKSKKKILSSIFINELVFTGIGEVSIQSKKLAPNSNLVLMESIFSAISHGTELKIYEGKFDSSIFMDPLDSITNNKRLDDTDGKDQLPYPLCYGYANLALDPKGDQYFCFVPHQDFFYQDLSRAIPMEDINPLDAVLFSNMETALSIVQDAEVKLGDRVLIAGQGLIGLLVTELCFLGGVSEVHVLEPLEVRASLARALSAHSYNPYNENDLENLRNFARVHPFDGLINISSNEKVLPILADLAVMEARIVESSWYGNQNLSINLGSDFHRKRLQLIMSQVSHLPSKQQKTWTKARRYELVKQMLEKVMPRKYISHIFPLSKGKEAYELIAKREDNCLQCLLDPKQ